MILLDTCTLLWLVGKQDQLPEAIKKIIAKHSQNLFVSAISSFEIAIKYKKGLLTLPYEPERWFPDVLEHHGIKEIPVDSSIFMRANALPDIHKDPADRVIIATADLHKLTILTPDTHIHAYPEAKTAW